jgi:hypothetical protein
MCFDWGIDADSPLNLAFSGASIPRRCPCIVTVGVRQSSTPFTGDDHIDLSRPALRTDEPPLPLDHGHLDTVAIGHVGGAGFDLVVALLRQQLILWNDSMRDNGTRLPRLSAN